MFRDIFNFYNLGTRGSDAIDIELVANRDIAKHATMHRTASTMKNYLVQNLNTAAVEIFCSSIYQTLFYFNISECNILFLNSDLHSLFMCRYQMTLFFPSLLWGRNFPTVCYTFIPSVPQRNMYCLMVSTVKGLPFTFYLSCLLRLFCAVHDILKTFLKMKLPQSNPI